MLCRPLKASFEEIARVVLERFDSDFLVDADTRDNVADLDRPEVYEPDAVDVIYDVHKSDGELVTERMAWMLPPEVVAADDGEACDSATAEPAEHVDAEA